MAKKQYKQRERRYVVEYVNEKFTERIFVKYNMPIGPPPEEMFKAHPEIPLAHFRRWRFFIDAVVCTKDKLYLLETKIRKPHEGLGQLLVYGRLLPETPELSPYANRPIELRLVTSRPDPRIIKVATSYGVKVDIWTKPWVQEYLHSLGLA